MKTGLNALQIVHDPVDVSSIIIVKNRMVKIIKIVLPIAQRLQILVIMMVSVLHILVKIQRIVQQIVSHPLVIEMAYVKPRMEKILLIALMTAL